MFSIRRILLTAGVMLGGWRVAAQAPSWVVNAANYQYTMSVVAFLNLDGKTLMSDQDKVGAFVGSEVRGESSVVSSADRYLAYLTIFGNTPNEKIFFKIYDSSTGRITDVSATLDFKIDGQIGNVFQAFSIAKPLLSKEADIKAFSFASISSASTEIGDGNIDVTVSQEEGLGSLTPEFVLSAGGKMYLDYTVMRSGVTTVDFSERVVFSVLSEDESVLKEWQVSVSHSQDAESAFFATNVITPNGDGANDFWIVTDVLKYSHAKFKIFDTNGRILFESVGYQNNWDGHYRGARLAGGKYFFVIKDPQTNSVIRGDILIRY